MNRLLVTVLLAGLVIEATLTDRLWALPLLGMACTSGLGDCSCHGCPCPTGLVLAPEITDSEEWEDWLNNVTDFPIQIQFTEIQFCSSGCQRMALGEAGDYTRWGWANNVRVTGAQLEGLTFCFENQEEWLEFGGNKVHPTAHLTFDFYESASSAEDFLLESANCTGTPEEISLPIYGGFDTFGTIFLGIPGLSENSLGGQLFHADSYDGIYTPSQSNYQASVECDWFNTNPHWLTTNDGIATVKICPPEEE